jgi:hypothetical protein
MNTKNHRRGRPPKSSGSTKSTSLLLRMEPREKQAFVLTTSEDGNPEVCDGQQRLANTTILIAAIRDYFQQQGDT